jgi:hypothetical protein
VGSEWDSFWNLSRSFTLSVGVSKEYPKEYQRVRRVFISKKKKK